MWRRRGGVGSNRLGSSVRCRAKGLPRLVSSPVHRCTTAHHHAPATAAPALQPRTFTSHTPAGLSLELELGLLGGPRLASLPSHAGQPLPHYAAAAAAPAGRSATMRGGGLTYPASIGAAVPPRHTARRSPRLGWAVSGQGWPRDSADRVNPIGAVSAAKRAAQPSAAPTPQARPQQPRMRQPSPQQQTWKEARPSSAAPTVSRRPVAAAAHHSAHRAAAEARPQSAAGYRAHAAGAAAARPWSAAGDKQRPQSAGADQQQLTKRAAVVRPQSASERRAETAEREKMLGTSGNRALRLCAVRVVAW